MVISVKRPSEQDAAQTLQGSYNDVDLSLTINGFLVGKVGRKIALALATTTVPDDTEIYTFSEDGVQLYEYTVVYVDATHEVMIYAERTA